MLGVTDIRNNLLLQQEEIILIDLILYCCHEFSAYSTYKVGLSACVFKEMS